MIDFKVTKNPRFIILGVFGSIMAFCGFLIYAYNPLQLIINTMLRLKPDNILFNIWTKPPYDTYINVYIFNVTNAEAFLLRGEKIRVEEVGPYVYLEKLYNTEAQFNENGTLTFRPRRNITLALDKSIGDPRVDWIISPNIPLLGITSSLKDSSMFVNLAITSISNYLGSKAFLNITIDEYLWGYDDPLVELANKAIPSWINFPRFGILDRIMALDNGENTVTIKVTDEKIEDNPLLTEEELVQPYSIQRFNGSPGLKQWGYQETTANETIDTNTRCNTIQSSYDGTLFPYDLKENSTFRVYRHAFCRPVTIKYESKGEDKHGFDQFTYRIDNKFLSKPEENPENSCYCKGRKCDKNGISNISPCYYDIPIVLSQPHHYNSDPALLQHVLGMEPDKDKHDTYIMLHPKAGVPLDAKLRIQINLDIDTKFNSKTKPFNKLLLPLFWIELTLEDTPFIVWLGVKMAYHIMPVIQIVCQWCFMILGVAMIAAAGLFTFFFPSTPSNHGLEDPFERIGYSPIRIVPMTTHYFKPDLRISKG